MTGTVEIIALYMESQLIVLNKQLRTIVEVLQLAGVAPEVGAAAIMGLAEQFAYEAIGGAVMLTADRNQRRDAIDTTIDELAAKLHARVTDMIVGLSRAETIARGRTA